MTAPLPPSQRPPIGPPYTPPSNDFPAGDVPVVPAANPDWVPEISHPREYHSPVQGVVREGETRTQLAQKRAEKTSRRTSAKKSTARKKS
jgi:hypothetical protein